MMDVIDQEASVILDTLISLEYVLNDKSELFTKKVQSLIQVWKQMKQYKFIELTETGVHFMDWLKLHTLNIVLTGDWKSVKDVYEEQLLKQITLCGELHGKFSLRCKKLANVIKDPWGNPVLNRILNTADIEIEREVIEFFCAETGYLISTRLIKLCESHCEDLALNLVRTYMRCEEMAEEGNFNLNATEDQKRFILDVFLALLYKYKDTKTLITKLQSLSNDEGLEVLKRFYKKQVKICKIWKYSRHIATVATKIYVTSALVKSTEDDIALVENIVKIWLTYNDAGGLEPLMATIQSFVQLCDSSIYIYLFCKILHEKFGTVMKKYTIELYIRALTTDMNDLERAKSDEDSQKITEITNRLAQGLLKLADVLEEHVKVNRECVLTSFSLQPTQSSLERIIKVAKSSGCNVLDTGQVWKCKRHPPVLPSDEVCYTCSYCGDFMSQIQLIPPLNTNTALSEALTSGELGLSSQLCDDLVVVLSSPRYHFFSWLLQWHDLYRLCVLYLNDQEGTKNFVTELKFVDIDYSLFTKVKPEPVDETDHYGYEDFLHQGLYQEHRSESGEDSPTQECDSSYTYNSDYSLNTFLPPETKSNPNILKRLREFRPNLKRTKIDQEDDDDDLPLKVFVTGETTFTNPQKSINNAKTTSASCAEESTTEKYPKLTTLLSSKSHSKPYHNENSININKSEDTVEYSKPHHNENSININKIEDTVEYSKPHHNENSININKSEDTVEYSKPRHNENFININKNEDTVEHNDLQKTECYTNQNSLPVDPNVNTSLSSVERMAEFIAYSYYTQMMREDSMRWKTSQINTNTLTNSPKITNDDSINYKPFKGNQLISSNKRNGQQQLQYENRVAKNFANPYNPSISYNQNDYDDLMPLNLSTKEPNYTNSSLNYYTNKSTSEIIDVDSDYTPIYSKDNTVATVHTKKERRKVNRERITPNYYQEPFIPISLGKKRYCNSNVSLHKMKCVEEQDVIEIVDDDDDISISTSRNTKNQYRKIDSYIEIEDDDDIPISSTPKNTIQYKTIDSYIEIDGKFYNVSEINSSNLQTKESNCSVNNNVSYYKSRYTDQTINFNKNAAIENNYTCVTPDVPINDFKKPFEYQDYNSSNNYGYVQPRQTTSEIISIEPEETLSSVPVPEQITSRDRSEYTNSTLSSKKLHPKYKKIQEEITNDCIPKAISSESKPVNTVKTNEIINFELPIDNNKQKLAIEIDSTQTNNNIDNCHSIHSNTKTKSSEKISSSTTISSSNKVKKEHTSKRKKREINNDSTNNSIKNITPKLSIETTDGSNSKISSIKSKEDISHQPILRLTENNKMEKNYDNNSTKISRKLHSSVITSGVNNEININNSKNECKSKHKTINDSSSSSVIIYERKSVNDTTIHIKTSTLPLNTVTTQSKYERDSSKISESRTIHLITNITGENLNIENNSVQISEEVYPRVNIDNKVMNESKVHTTHSKREHKHHKKNHTSDDSSFQIVPVNKLHDSRSHKTVRPIVLHVRNNSKSGNSSKNRKHQSYDIVPSTSNYKLYHDESSSEEFDSYSTITTSDNPVIESKSKHSTKKKHRSKHKKYHSRTHCKSKRGGKGKHHKSKHRKFSLNIVKYQRKLDLNSTKTKESHHTVPLFIDDDESDETHYKSIGETSRKIHSSATNSNHEKSLDVKYKTGKKKMYDNLVSSASHAEISNISNTNTKNGTKINSLRKGRTNRYVKKYSSFESNKNTSTVIGRSLKRIDYDRKGKSISSNRIHNKTNKTVVKKNNLLELYKKYKLKEVRVVLYRIPILEAHNRKLSYTPSEFIKLIPHRHRHRHRQKLRKLSKKSENKIKKYREKIARMHKVEDDTKPWPLQDVNPKVYYRKHVKAAFLNNDKKNKERKSNVNIMNPCVVLKRLEFDKDKKRITATSMLANVPGLNDLQMIRPSSVDRIVQVVQVPGTRNTNTPVSCTQTSTQVTPHIQRIGQPRTEKPDSNDMDSISTLSTSSTTVTTAVTTSLESPTLINILSQGNQVNSIASRPRSSPLINILSQQIIKPGTTGSSSTKVSSPGNSDVQVNSMPKVIASEDQTLNQLINPLRAPAPTLKTLVNTPASDQNRIVQFICKSSDGKLIPVTSFTSNKVVKVSMTQTVSSSTTGNSNDENHTKITQNSSKSKSEIVDNSDILPKFQQAFRKPSYQNSVDSSEGVNTNNDTVNNDSEKSDNVKTSAKNSNASLNIQPVQGGVIYTRQMPIGQAINLIPPACGQVFRIATTNTEQLSLVKDTVIHGKMSALLAAALQGKQRTLDNNEVEVSSEDKSQKNTRVTIATRPTLVQNACIVKPVLQIPSNVIRSAPQSNLSSTTLEQLREFDMVYKQVKERSSTGVPNETSPHSDSNEPQQISVTYLNQSQKINCAPVVVVSSYCNVQPAASPSLSVTSQGSSSPCVTPAPTLSLSSKSSIKTSKSKSVKSTTTHTTKSTPIQKPQQKPQEDEHTTQRIFDILAEYAEQLRNSPDLNNKPAPRRRSNPPTNPNQNSKRKKNSSSKKPGNSSNSVPSDGDVDDTHTVGSEDSSCGVVQISVQEEEQPVATVNTSEPNEPSVSPKQIILTDSTPQNQSRSLIIADSNVGEALKMSNTAVLVPGNYIMPVSMVKGGQQIAVVSGGSKILATVPARSGHNMLLFQSFLNQTRKHNVSTVKYSAVQPISGITRNIPGVTTPANVTPVSQNVTAVTLAQTVSLQKVNNAENSDTNNFDTELLFTITQPQETKNISQQQRSQQDSKIVSTSADDAQSIKIADTILNTENSSGKSSISASVATSVIAQSICIKEELSDQQSRIGQTAMALNLNSSDNEKDTTIKVEGRVHSVLVATRTANGPMLSHSHPTYNKRTISTNSISECNKDDYLRKDGKRNNIETKTLHNTIFTYHSKIKKLHGNSPRLDRELQQLCLQRKQAALERDLRLQKTLSEECEDLGVGEPSTSDLFPEADLLFDSNHSPSFDQTSQDITKRTPATEEVKDEVKTIGGIFSDDEPADYLFEPIKYQNEYEYNRSKEIRNGHCSTSNESRLSCEDNNMLQTCTSMSDLTIPSPGSPDTYADCSPPPLNKYKYKYSNRKKLERSKQIENWPIELSSSEDTTGSAELVKSCSRSPDLFSGKNNQNCDDEYYGFTIVEHLPVKEGDKCNSIHCNKIMDCPSGRSARRSVKKLCSCCNGSTKISRKRSVSRPPTPLSNKKTVIAKKR